MHEIPINVVYGAIFYIPCFSKIMTALYQERRGERERGGRRGGGEGEGREEREVGGGRERASRAPFPYRSPTLQNSQKGIPNEMAEYTHANKAHQHEVFQEYLRSMDTSLSVAGMEDERMWV